MKQKIDQCHICNEVTECKHLDIYHMGSEGLAICFPCEMKLITYIRDERRKNTESRRNKYMEMKKGRNK